MTIFLVPLEMVVLKMAIGSVSNTKGDMAGSYNLQSQNRREDWKRK